MSSKLKLGALLAAAAMVTACSTTEAPGPIEPTGTFGRVRLVNVITDATRGFVNASLEGLVFTVNLQYAQAAPANLGAPATAPYAPVYTGNRSFVLKRTADTTVTVATLPFTIAAAQDLSVYAIGGVGGSAITSVIITDDNTLGSSSQTRFRSVNMSPTGGALDFFVTAAGADLATANPVASNVAYKAASAYAVVAPGTYVVRAVPAGTAAANRNAAVVFTSASTVFGGATVRTAIAADAATGGTPLRGFVLLDR
ncbi:MAG TPA: DUF4397 domain-containing protein [Gemmatimonadaceae bacterium]|nr:DUF4397 domain-containing protein [Gemmatimonadaceae bacterium]